MAHLMSCRRAPIYRRRLSAAQRDRTARGDAADQARPKRQTHAPHANIVGPAGRQARRWHPPQSEGSRDDGSSCPACVDRKPCSREAASAACSGAPSEVRTRASYPAKKRRGRDSNPRTGSTPVTRFPVAPVQPLRHLSNIVRDARRLPKATDRGWDRCARTRALGGAPTPDARGSTRATRTRNADGW